MDSKSPNGKSDLRPVTEGIRLVLEEIRDLRREAEADRKRVDEDRRRADEDRKRADEKFERYVAESNERFERHSAESKEHFGRYVAESTHREKELSRAVAIIGHVGRDILKTQKTHTRLLQQILHAVRGRLNGKTDNGHRRR